MLWGVAVASFLESLILPIPLETLLIPLMQARRDKLIAIAMAALIGCLVGATLGYTIGLFIFESVGNHLIAWLWTMEQYHQVEQQMQLNGFWFVLSVGITPVPFQLAMLAAGAMSYAFLLFLLATLLARGLRYFGLAILVWKFGDAAQSLFQRHKVSVSVVILTVVALFWLLLLS